VAPLCYAAAAARDYEAMRLLRAAKQYTFTEDTVRLQEGDCFVQLPLSMLSDVCHTKRGYLLFFEGVYVFMLPDRALDPADTAFLQTLLRRQARDTHP